MPASLFTEMERSSISILEDQRALQLAMELSMFTLGNESESGYSSGGYESESRSKKSQNTTECVPVPSSEHVAEIVGRQGCKIKALRAKTNTYIKTPVRGEEPVFVVTGRKEDVSAAKREILSAAEHFSQIRAQRKNNMNGSLAPGPNSSIPGQTTIQVRVPYRVVGLVVGPKGATIKRIQQQTNTYIVTPSREKEPVFEVTGLPDNVETARKEIEAHIAMRTGGLPDSSTTNGGSSGNNSASEDDDFHVNGIERVFTAATVATTNYVNSLYKSDFGNANASLSRDSNNILTSRTQDIFTFPSHAISADGGSPKMTDIYSCTPGFPNGFSTSFGLYDVDEGLGDSPTFEQAVFPSTSNVWSDFGPVQSTMSPLFGTTTTSTAPSAVPRRSNSLGSADSGISDPLLLDHPPARRIRSDPLVDTLANFPPITAVSTVSTIANCFTATSCTGTSNSATSPTDSISSSLRKSKRDCAVCFESEIVAALVPCGHNMFCLECANRICEKAEPECPICRQQAHQAIRIYS
ncbi:RNA-binding protein MEX3B-like [Stegodyphus dumicola]|uniref:RNA-binding protein MEX3B-like n=1 Tax=Stegodyphus dumicola TaxID=202533 RepID=UPI0015AE2D2E|nr:RNA-binding protein MEX3B-like [Stegodyphus dumicola]